MTDRTMTRWRRAAAVAAAGILSTAGLAACGHHHDVPAAAPASSTSSSTSSTSTTVPHRQGTLDPLTGLPVTAAEARHGAVVVKVDNISAALPQTGINQADVVYEEMVEGGLTRLAAVFQSDLPRTVGPVRSGRLTDEGIADDLDHPVLAYAGANGLFQPKLAAQPVHIADDDNYPDLYYRDNARLAPNNLYSDVAELAATVSHPSPPKALWSFRSTGAPFEGAGVQPATAVSIAFPAASATWTWDAKTGQWMRTQDGVADTDSTGTRVAAANVIVEVLTYVTSAYVSGEGAAAQGTPIPTGEMVGHGTAWFLSGGRVVKGTWHRASLTSPTVYTDSAGARIRLAPGRTWVELPDAASAVRVTH